MIGESESQTEPNLAQRWSDGSTAIPGFSNWDLATVQKFGEKKCALDAINPGMFWNVLIIPSRK